MNDKKIELMNVILLIFNGFQRDRIIWVIMKRSHEVRTWTKGFSKLSEQVQRRTWLQWRHLVTTKVPNYQIIAVQNTSR